MTTKSESGHTPTPWKIAPHYGEKFHSGTILGADGRSVCSINGTIKRSPEEKYANAALIVRAVNSHAALVAKFERIAELERHTRQGGPASEDLEELSDALNEAIQIANTALSLAKGESK